MSAVSALYRGKADLSENLQIFLLVEIKTKVNGR